MRFGRTASATPLYPGLLELVFTDFQELHGDRNYADDHAIVGGWRASTASRAW
jgi:acetyl-CoA carboxylase alpha subunit